MKALIKTYDKSKYKSRRHVISEIKISNLAGYEVIYKGVEAVAIEQKLDIKDENGEYFKLKYQDGTSTYLCASKCDLFTL